MITAMKNAATDLTVRYTTLDRFSQTRKFKTLVGAQRYAHKWVGPHPDTSASYAVSSDGMGKITVSGCTLDELFPSTSPVKVRAPEEPSVWRCPTLRCDGRGESDRLEHLEHGCPVYFTDLPF